MSCIDKGDIVGTLFLDFRKALDLIDHSSLIKKLSIHKFRDSTLKLLASYVMDRHQVMESNTGTSRLGRPSRIYLRAYISFNVSK